MREANRLLDGFPPFRNALQPSAGKKQQERNGRGDQSGYPCPECALPNAAAIHTVAAVVRPSTVPVTVFLSMTPAPIKVVTAMMPWMTP
jgi:hypothetical protein